MLCVAMPTCLSMPFNLCKYSKLSCYAVPVWLGIPDLMICVAVIVRLKSKSAIFKMKFRNRNQSLQKLRASCSASGRKGDPSGLRREHRSLLSPIQHCPIEIFSEISVFCSPDSFETEVCRVDRDVAPLLMQIHVRNRIGEYLAQAYSLFTSLGRFITSHLF